MFTGFLTNYKNQIEPKKELALAYAKAKREVSPRTPTISEYYLLKYYL